MSTLLTSTLRPSTLFCVGTDPPGLEVDGLELCRLISAAEGTMQGMLIPCKPHKIIS